MQSYIKVLNNYELAQITKKLKQYRLPNPSTNLKHFFKVGKMTISIFNTNRMMIQGQNASAYGDELLLGAKASNPKPLSPNYIGCDEVGVGDYFGGLVTCAVYLKKVNEQQLIDLGVKDSKNLTDQRMRNIYPTLIKLVDYECLVYEPAKYNQLVAKFHNTHAIKTCMHDKTIKRLINDHNIPVETSVVMDQYANKETYYKYFKILNIPNPALINHFETKAENKYLAVAAASIIARVNFLNHINDLSKKIGFQLLLGASNPKIIDQAKTIYGYGGKTKLNQFVKIDFKTTEKVIN
jgi:ribonuclease HIII